MLIDIFKINSKKKLVLLVIMGILVVAIIATGTVFLIKNFNNKNIDSRPVDATADVLKSQAIDALKNQDNEKAKDLFIEAKQKYQAAGDNNNVVDTEAQIWLIDHSGVGN